MQSVTIMAAILFALSGLTSGFAFGTFIHNRQSPFASFTGKTPPIPTLSGATPSPTPGPRPLGCPTVQPSSSQQHADAHTIYTASIQAAEKYQNQTCNLEGKQAALHDDGLTCRLWLMAGDHDPLKLPEDHIKKMQLTGPLPDGAEVANGLIFDNSTKQTQPCQQGKGTWKYTISTSVPEGNYYLMGLTVWAGQYYNWSWSSISIKNANTSHDNQTNPHNKTGDQTNQHEKHTDKHNKKGDK